MKHAFFLLCTLLGSLLPLGLRAQTAFVGGQLLGEDSQKPLQAATVLLLQLPDSTEEGRITGEDGRFRFQVPAGTYRLRVERQGYQPLEQRLDLKGGIFSLGEISLPVRTFDLDEVAIEGKKIPVRQLGDTTQYNAGSYQANPDATAEQLLEKMPGMVVQNGNVQAQGEDVKQVLVDGKPFLGNDPTAALRTLPAEVIDQIQVFDQQSEQSQFSGFDDDNTIKTLNIITKPSMRNGTFGKLYAGYGTDERYKAGGNVNFFNGERRLSLLGQTNNLNQQNFAPEDLLGVMSGGGGGRGQRGGGGRRGGGVAGDFVVPQQQGIATTHAAGINYSDKWGEKWEVSGSYFFNQTSNDALTFLRQQYVSTSDSGQVYTERDSSFTRNRNHRFNLRMEYNFNERNSLLIRPRVTWQENTGTSLSSALTTRSDARLNQSLTDFSADLAAVNANLQLLYRHRFEKQGRTLSVDLQTGYSESNGTNQLFSAISFPARPTASDTLDQQARLDSDGLNLQAQLSYTEPLGETSQLELRYEYNPQLTHSDQQTYNFDPFAEAYSRRDTSLSNVFRTDYTAHQASAGLRLRVGSGFMLFRLSAQQATLQNETTFPVANSLQRDFFNVLPFALARFRLSPDKNLFFIYRGSTSPPNVTQLQEVVNNSNPLQLTAGNPELAQNFQHFLLARYSHTNTARNRLFFWLLRAQLTQHHIANSTLIAENDQLLPSGVFLPQGAQLTRPVNLDGYWNLRTFVTIGQPLDFLKTNLNLNLGGGFVRTPGLINDELNYSSNSSLDLGVVLSSNISPNVDFTLSSRSSFNWVDNTLRDELDNRYFNQVSGARLNLIFWQGVVLRSELKHSLYRGLAEEFNTDFWLWEMAVAKKFLKNDRAELALSVFDVLGQNTSISRTVNDIYFQDTQTQVLQTYGLLTFTYNLREFDGKPTMPMMGPDGHPMGPPPGERRP